MLRLSRWLCHVNVFDLWHAVPIACSGHWHNYILQPRQVEQSSAQSIFLICLWVNESLWQSVIRINDFWSKDKEQLCMPQEGLNSIGRCHVIQHNYTQHNNKTNYTLLNDTQHNDMQPDNKEHDGAKHIMPSILMCKILLFNVAMISVPIIILILIIIMISYWNSA